MLTIELNGTQVLIPDVLAQFQSLPSERIARFHRTFLSLAMIAFEEGIR
jgi:hypothetical protein